MKKILFVLLISIFMISFGSANLNTDLALYYKLDGTTGDVLDSTPSGNNGTNFGADRGVVGIINNSFDFEESDSDYVNIPNKITSGANVSTSFWINMESPGTTSMMMLYQDD